MKSINYRAGQLLAHFGVSLARDRMPFRHLLTVPRFTPQTVNVAGTDIVVGDGPTFVSTYREIFVDRIYSFETISASPRIIDCGANFGISVLFFKHVHPAAKITAVEADPAIFRTLSENVRCSRHDDVELLNRAVSHDDTPITFHVDGSDSGRIHPLAGASEVVPVSAVTLDQLIDGPVDLLKIDIEGAETAALLACGKLDLVDKIFVEYHSFPDTPQALPELLTALRDAGFRYYIQTQLCAARPLERTTAFYGMDLQLNIFARRD